MITPIEFTHNLMSNKGVGNMSVYKLFDEYPDFKALINNFEKNENIRDELKRIIFVALSKEIENRSLLENSLCLWDENYPDLLRKISDPPARIFYRGTLAKNIFHNTVSIVGTRKASSYARKIVEEIIDYLSFYNINIVSGMAMGIDSFAHLQTIKNNLKTIAVLGSSIDDPTPKTNEKLYNKIIESEGLVISEHPPKTTVRAGMFAARNRIIAGLSRACVIVQAPEGSGALITANLSLEYGREVFAVAGNFFDNSFRGSHKILANHEAQLLYSPEQILANLSIIPNTSLKKITIADLSEYEKELVFYLMKKPATFDEIHRDVQGSSLASVLSDLELKGVIKRAVNGEYELIAIVG